jgi:hypothetical protein
MESINDIFIKDFEVNKSPSQFQSQVGIIENYKEVSKLDKNLRHENYISLEQEVLTQFIPRNFIAYEEWVNIENIFARILSKSDDIVSCECLIDKENLEFQIRNFPIILFKNINMKINEFVLITIKTKEGSSRIDIRNGNGIVDETYFDINDEWEELRNSGLDKPFSQR